jgi:hypothetical protein
MNREARAKHVGLRAGKRSDFSSWGLLLALLVCCSHASALRAADYISDVVTQVSLLGVHSQNVVMLPYP